MDTVTLTLTRAEALKVLAFLNTSPESHSSLVAVDNTKKVVAPALPKQTAVELLTVPSTKTAGKITKMPTFGRTAIQIQAFAEAEEARVDMLDEEAELKRQRQEERDVIKAEKDAEKAEIKKEKEFKAQEVEVIKQVAVKVNMYKPVAKPWGL